MTSFCNLSFNSFSSFINFSCFNSKDLVISVFTLSYKLLILLISSWILFFRLITFSINCSNSFDEDLISIFSFFNDSASSISNNLCPL